MSMIEPLVSSRFQHHVSFDTFASGESTEKNTLAFTLNVKHKGYQFKRRSRTFMVGVGENEYSDIALQWMLEELVDDGDEIICVRVIDKDSKVVNDRNVEKREYQTEAKELLQRIQVRNDENRAIGIVLEFVAGKLHSTFQRMIQLYEPAMLIVGTKGRSLGGLHGLMSNRNSFSKWCLQYSPIPVVVVRPTMKRIKKKKKRDADPTRQDYVRILRDSGIEEHETDTDSQSSNWEISNDPDIEAHAVATALGLYSESKSIFKPTQSEETKSGMKYMLDCTDAKGIFQSKYSSDITNARVRLIPELDSYSKTSSIKDSDTKGFLMNETEHNATSNLPQSSDSKLSETVESEVTDIMINYQENSSSGFIFNSDVVPQTSESSLDTCDTIPNEYIHGEESDKDETEFEVIPGKFLLKDSGILPSRSTEKLEELELDLLTARETKFLAAQIAREFSMDRS